jgi:uncharacterized membrane protein YhaH (DUF805 family)
MILEPFVWGPPVLLWAVVAYRLRAILRGPQGATPEARALLLVFVSGAGGSTILLPPIYQLVAGWSGMPHLAHLFADVCMLGAVWSFQVFLFEVGQTSSDRRRRIGYDGWLLSAFSLGCMVAVLALLFAAAQISGEMVESGATGTATACGPACDQPNAVFLFAYRSVLLTYLLVSCISLTRRCWRDAALSQDAALRLGLRLVALGTLVGFAYMANEELYLATRRFGLHYPLQDPDALSRVLTALIVVLLMVGSTIPAWGPAVYLWAWRYRAHRRLYVLWEDLRRANPGIALFPAPSRLGDILGVRDLDLSLRRRVIEIRDGRDALRPHAHPWVELYARTLATEAGLARDTAGFVVEAAILAAACRAKVLGWPAEHPALPPAPPVGPGLESEVNVLGPVARNYRGSPVVLGVVAEIDRRYRSAWGAGTRSSATAHVASRPLM